MRATIASASIPAQHPTMADSLRHATGARTESLKTLQTALRATFTIVPVVAGLDKFTNLLVNWEQYVNPMLAHMLPFSPHALMAVVGIVEIAAGAIVFLRPRAGSLIVAGWLGCIALSLIAGGIYLDVAVRDLVMAMSALTLAGLTRATESTPA